MVPNHILLLDIDGLRPDVFRAALESGAIPNIASLLGGSRLSRGVQIPMVAPAPSITFCAQASLFTGTHPNDHGIPGSQFFDRFGSGSDGQPRSFAFNIGDTLAVDDAVRAFSDGLAATRLQVPTFYERMAGRGRTSIVAGNMYARGADTWLKPSLVKLARLTKGGALFGLDAADFDRDTLDALVSHIAEHGLPDGAIVTMYFLGLDHESHRCGPQAQGDYLSQHIDPMVGRLWQVIDSAAAGRSTVVALFSDHGQIGVPAEEHYALRLGFPRSGVLGRFFDALGLDVCDYPGEDPDCDAVAALNGGLAHVYLRNQSGRWSDPPDLARDILPVGRALWEAHSGGAYASELRGALSGVLLRHVERAGWAACYEALTPEGSIQPLAGWFARQPADLYVDPVHRLNNLAGPFAGDLLLISNYSAGYYFGGPVSGVHGGLHPDDSLATLVYGWPVVSTTRWEAAKRAIVEAIEARCRAEGGRQPAASDMLTGVEAVQGPGG